MVCPIGLLQWDEQAGVFLQATRPRQPTESHANLEPGGNYDSLFGFALLPTKSVAPDGPLWPRTLAAGPNLLV